MQRGFSAVAGEADARVGLYRRACGESTVGGVVALEIHNYPIVTVE